MLNRIIVVGLVLSLCGAVLADYVLDRQAAMALVKSGKYEEAKAAFVKMAEGKVTDFQKSDALEQAALCAVRLKKYDEAIDLAEQVPLEPVSKSVRMRILMSRRKWRELIDAFKDENMAAWPDSVAGDGFHLRGQAHSLLKHGKAAEADLTKALDYLADNFARARVWLDLGNNYRDNLKDDGQALKAYAQTVELNPGHGSWVYLTAVTSSSVILSRQKEFDEALKVLDAVDTAKLRGYWRGAVLAARGEVFAARGKTAEALARFREALRVEGIPDHGKRAWEKRIGEIQGKTLKRDPGEARSRPG